MHNLEWHQTLRQFGFQISASWDASVAQPLIFSFFFSDTLYIYNKNIYKLIILNMNPSDDILAKTAMAAVFQKSEFVEAERQAVRG